MAAPKTQMANNRDSFCPNVSPTLPLNKPDVDGEDSNFANRSGRATNSAKESPQQTSAITWLDMIMYVSPQTRELGNNVDRPI